MSVAPSLRDAHAVQEMKILVPKTDAIETKKQQFEYMQLCTHLFSTSFAEMQSLSFAST
jgi:hypothetical protein